MELEIISRLPKTDPRPTPLLFIHGAFCGAWVWEEHFLPYFADQGFAAHAVSLRGHGKSEGHPMLPLFGVSDYLEDLVKTVDAMDSPPLLIGQSMGGVVVQRFLQERAAPGAVLLGAGPPHGMIASSVVTFLNNPLMSTQVSLIPILQVLGSNPMFMDMSRKVLFSKRMGEDEAIGFLRRTQLESLRAIFELSWPHRAINQGNTPLLVLGAKDDYFVTPYMVRATAKAYKTEAEILPDMGHAMMVEPGWKSVADRIIRWIDDGLPVRSPQDSEGSGS